MANPIMKVVKSSGFKYLKNLIIGVGASVVLVGALYKIMSWPGADQMLMAGLLTEAGLFLMLGILPPDSDYYWSKLYPGLDDYNATVQPLTAGGGGGSQIKFDSKKLEDQNELMIQELQNMAKSLSSLKALQEVDFSQTGAQIKKMGDFYANLNTAMESLNNSVEDTKVYREQLATLNQNLGSLNKVYGGMLSAMKGN
jgi:hypothetical protein